MKKLLSLILAVILVVSAVFVLTSCGDGKASDGNAVADIGASAMAEAVNIGQGETKFNFTVIDAEGNEKTFNVSTDKSTVGEALVECKLIDGEMGAYGLYVKTVDGKTLDYDKDGKYWAFYVDGEMSPVGVDMAEIKEDSVYSFRAE